MSSIQVRHKAGCASGRKWQKADDVKASGCDCEPSRYILSKVGGKLHYERVRGSMKDAQAALRKVGHEVDEQRYTPPTRVKFETWADRWIASLQRKPSTVESYKGTIQMAKKQFGHKPVRDVTTDDIRRLLQSMEHV